MLKERRYLSRLNNASHSEGQSSSFDKAGENRRLGGVGVEKSACQCSNKASDIDGAMMRG